MIGLEYYSLELHLKQFQDIPEFSSIYNNWCLDKKEIAKALSAIPHYYPHYSDHDESHSLKIIRNIEMLLGPERIRSLGPTTTWIILMVAYLHDTGMILIDNILSEQWKQDEFHKYIASLRAAQYDKYDADYVQAADYLLSINDHANSDPIWPLKVRHSVILIASEYFRRSHPLYSRDALERLEKYGLSISAFRTVPQRLKHLIGQISYLHGQPFDEVMKLDYEANGVGTDRIYPRFIAQLLRIGDLLDLDDGRFTKVYQNMIMKMPDLSATHEEKHASVRHFLINPQVIEITADCQSASIYRATQSWVNWIEDELKNFAINWSETVPKNFMGGPPRLGKTKLFLKGKGDLSEQANLRFEIKQENAFDIIEGSGIYETKTIFLRELLQNAIDATKIQLWTDVQTGRYDRELEINGFKNSKEINLITDIPLSAWNAYTIDINIETDETEKIVISITDHGCGIGQNEIKRIANVGQSWKSSKVKWELISTMPDWLKPTGAFGIGLQSIFLVSDEATIFTKKDGDKGKKISLVSRKKNGYITIEEDGDIQRRGTKILLEINKKIFSHEIRKGSEEDYFINPINTTSLLTKKIINLMKKYMDGCLFDIRFFHNQILVDKINKYQFLQDELLNNYIIDNDLSYRIIWNKETGLIEIDLLENRLGIIFKLNSKVPYGGSGFEFSANRLNKISFKGVAVDYARQNYFKIKYVSTEIDLLSDSTKNYLNLARSSIKKDRINEVVNNIDIYMKKSLELLFQFISKEKISILEMASEIKESQLNDQEKRDKLYPIGSVLFNCLHLNIAVDIELVRSFVTVFILSTAMDAKGNEVDHSYLFTEDEIIVIDTSYEEYIETVELMDAIKINEELSEFVSDTRYIVFNNIETIHSYINQSFRCTDVFLIDWMDPSGSEPSELVCIKLKRKKSHNSYHLIKGKFNMKHHLQGLGGSELDLRVNMLPVESYSEIVVKKTPIYNYSSGIRRYQYQSAYIISPFLYSELEDFKCITLTPNQLYKIACEKMGLDNVIKWVQVNSIHNPAPSIETIESAYRRLIKDYLDCLKQDGSPILEK